MNFLVLFALFASFAFLPSRAWACACGCGVFDVGTNSMYPTSTGGMVYFEFDYLNQNQNRHDSMLTGSEQNSDKQIKTSFLTLGGEYMFNRSHGIQFDLPYLYRKFVTQDNSNPDTTDTFTHGNLGDVRVRGLYTGLSEDMSTGFTYGVKLPTGDSRYANFDPDTELGSGSTDLLLGIYHMGKITQDGRFDWFGQFNYQQPLMAKPGSGYLPGNQIDMAWGAYYNGFTFGSENKVAPIFEFRGSFRGSDSGGGAAQTLAGGPASGYSRFLIAPGLEADFGHFRIFGAVILPVYQYYVGDQLAAPFSSKIGLAYNF